LFGAIFSSLIEPSTFFAASDFTILLSLL